MYDNLVVLGRRLHRKVARFLALEDAIDVAGREQVRIDRVETVGDQAAASDEVARRVDRGQSVPRRQRDDQAAMNYSRSARQHDEAAIRDARECGDGALDLQRVAHVDLA
jgi:hypothetical protein